MYRAKKNAELPDTASIKIALELLKEVRATLFMEEDSALITKFNPGDLVLDRKNGEVAFVVGPFNPYKEPETSIAKQLFSGQRESDPRIMLISRPKVVEKTGRDISQFRVRYTKESSLEAIPDVPLRSHVPDIQTFCKERCIMDCTTECELYKYKKDKL